jgi:hypothetical protein
MARSRPPKPSFDHLVGLSDDQGWNLDAEDPRCLQVHHHFEGRGLLDGQIRRYGPCRILCTNTPARRDISSTLAELG